MNAVLAAVAIMLVMSLCRIHVVVALIVGALAGGLIGGLGMEGTLAAFTRAWAPVRQWRCPTRCWARLQWRSASPVWPMRCLTVRWPWSANSRAPVAHPR